jgi:hypothetical protein
MTMETTVAMVWPLTLDAWAFKGEPVAESRLPRHGRPQHLVDATWLEENND